MAKQVVTIDKLANTILKTMQKYTEDVKRLTYDETDKLSKEVAEEVEKAGGYEDRTGKYRTGFYIKENYDPKKGGQFVVANTEYQLTHLLEFGHIIKSTGGRTRVFPHWQQGQELAKELPKRIRKAIKDAAKTKGGA